MNQELIERWQTEFETADAETVRLMLAEAPELVNVRVNYTLSKGNIRQRAGNPRRYEAVSGLNLQQVCPVVLPSLLQKFQGLTPLRVAFLQFSINKSQNHGRSIAFSS